MPNTKPRLQPTLNLAVITCDCCDCQQLKAEIAAYGTPQDLRGVMELFTHSPTTKH